MAICSPRTCRRLKSGTSSAPTSAPRTPSCPLHLESDGRDLGRGRRPPCRIASRHQRHKRRMWCCRSSRVFTPLRRCAGLAEGAASNGEARRKSTSGCDMCIGLRVATRSFHHLWLVAPVGPAAMRRRARSRAQRGREPLGLMWIKQNCSTFRTSRWLLVGAGGGWGVVELPWGGATPPALASPPPPASRVCRASLPGGDTAPHHPPSLSSRPSTQPTARAAHFSSVLCTGYFRKPPTPLTPYSLTSQYTHTRPRSHPP